MANDELGDRVVYAPRGRNAEDDLAACILKATRIFLMDGGCFWAAMGERHTSPTISNGIARPQEIKPYPYPLLGE